MSTHKIRTTMLPNEEIEVSPTELASLEEQGLVLKTKATTDEGLQRAAVRQAEAPKAS